MNEAKKKARRRDGAELKQQILAQRTEPGASVASIALAHNINANVVHKWRRKADGALPALQAPAFVSPASTIGVCTCTCAGHPHRTAPWCHQRRSDLALGCDRAVCRVNARFAQVIRVDALWLDTQPLDKRAGTETASTRVVSVFGAARPHYAYLFANRSAKRMKVLVHDGIGVWLAARRLNSGKFV